MINYPKNWQHIGRKVLAKEIAEAIQLCVSGLGIRNLSLSGGIDSTMLLYFMKQVVGNPIHCYTIATDETHPDYIHAKLATDFFNVKWTFYSVGDITPDETVKLFYKNLSSDGVKEIVAGDGIDEFTCGYYSHQEDRSEDNYISWIRRLYKEQLVPLNENSGDVEVYLPYLSPDIINLLSLVPVSEKVDEVCRKKIIVKMATGNIPGAIINRRKFGFCDASSRKDLL